jgi:hypothetical protein
LIYVKQKDSIFFKVRKEMKGQEGEAHTNFCPVGEGAGRTETVLSRNVYIRIIAPEPDNFDPHYYQQAIEDRKHHGEIIQMQYPNLEEK